MIYVDEQAAKWVRQKLEQTGASALRIEVKSSGCSGYKYDFSLAERVETDDHVVCEGGARLVIDPLSLVPLLGSTLILEQTPFKKQLKLLNPNVTQTCGCGESFSV